MSTNSAPCALPRWARDDSRQTSSSFRPAGVWRRLWNRGISFRRGQPHLHAAGSGGRTPGPPGLSKHQHLASSIRWGPLWENFAPYTGVNSRQLENKEMSARELPPRPTPTPRSWSAFVHPGRHLFGFANILIHRNSRRGWGWGLGWCVGRPSVFIQAFSSPRKWQQHSRDMQWCASTIHTTQMT